MLKTQMEILEKIMNCVNEQPVSFMGLCRQTGFNYRTVRRHLELIELLQQQSPKIEILRDGFRVVIRKKPVESTASN
jgi:predicted transcriptional regulator